MNPVLPPHVHEDLTISASQGTALRDTPAPDNGVLSVVAYLKIVRYATQRCIRVIYSRASHQPASFCEKSKTVLFLITVFMGIACGSS